MTHPTNSTLPSAIFASVDEATEVQIAFLGYSAHRIDWHRYQRRLGQSIIRKLKREHHHHHHQHHRHQHKPHLPVPGGLQTAGQAAAKLNCSIKTLKGHVKLGDLKYVVIGHGSERPRKMFTVADLDQFIANQTREEAPSWPSSKTRARHTGDLTSNSKVIA